jgi:methionine-rich copper-binding protein CopC
MLIAALAISALAGQARAHVDLTKASPAANARGPAPAAIRLEFSGRIEPKFSGLELVKADGSKAPVASAVGPDGRVLVARPAAALAPGAYKVMWRIVSADGHRMTGDYSFTVR